MKPVRQSFVGLGNAEGGDTNVQAGTRRNLTPLQVNPPPLGFQLSDMAGGPLPALHRTGQW
jgi:hypothetical protein